MVGSASLVPVRAYHQGFSGEASTLRNGRLDMLLGGVLTVNKGKHKCIPLLYILLLSVPCWAQGDFLMVTHGEPMAVGGVMNHQANARLIQPTDLYYNKAGLRRPTFHPEMGRADCLPPFQAGSGARQVGLPSGSSSARRLNVTGISRPATCPRHSCKE